MINSITNNLNPINMDVLNNSSLIVKDKSSNEIFDAFLSASTEMLEKTNQYQKTAEIEQMKFATGESDDVLAVMMANQNATTSLNFTVQVTNKVLEAYTQIMQIQL